MLSARESLLFTSDCHEHNTSFHYLYVDDYATWQKNPFWDWQAAVKKIPVNLTKLLLQLIDTGNRYEF